MRRLGHVAVFWIIALTLQVLAMVPASSAHAGELREPFAFDLVDHRNQPVTEATFKGKVTLLFVGFTSCPDICPTTLLEFSEVLAAIGAAADQVNVVFASADPANDTPDVLRAYLSSFDARIVGLTGNVDEVDRLAQALGIPFKRVAQGSGYTVDHSIMAVIMDRDWRRVGLAMVGHGASRERIVKRLLEMVAR